MSEAGAALVLFDVDATLLVSRPANHAAVLEVWRRLFDRELRHDERTLAGNLDPAIWRVLCAHNGVEEADRLEPRFRALYAEVLAEELAGERPARALPGAADLLAELEERPGLTLGLLTGNWPETGRLKLASAGFDPERFRVAAWGDDGPSRRELVPVALRRYREQVGEEVEPGRVAIIGDTPSDVDCARAAGCRSLGVASGDYSIEELVAAGADLAIADLLDATRIAAWILGDRQPP